MVRMLTAAWTKMFLEVDDLTFPRNRSMASEIQSSQDRDDQTRRTVKGLRVTEQTNRHFFGAAQSSIIVLSSSPRSLFPRLGYYPEGIQSLLLYLKLFSSATLRSIVENRTPSTHVARARIHGPCTVQVARTWTHLPNLVVDTTNNQANSREQNTRRSNRHKKNGKPQVILTFSTTKIQGLFPCQRLSATMEVEENLAVYRV